MTCTAHHFWRGTCVIGHHWEGEGASSLGPQKYPTAPCLVLPAPWLSLGSPPSSRWGRQVGSTSNLSAGSGENNGGGCDKIQRGRGWVGRTTFSIATYLSWCAVGCQCVGGELRRSFKVQIWSPCLHCVEQNISEELKFAWQAYAEPWWPVTPQEEIYPLWWMGERSAGQKNSRHVYVCVTFVHHNSEYFNTFLWDFLLDLHPPQ